MYMTSIPYPFFFLMPSGGGLIMAAYVISVVSASPAQYIGKKCYTLAPSLPDAIRQALTGFKDVVNTTATTGANMQYGFLAITGKNYCMTLCIELDK
jgi:hypothetical protein